MKMKKTVWVLVLFLGTTLLMMGCADDAEESRASPGENESAEITEAAEKASETETTVVKEDPKGEESAAEDPEEPDLTGIKAAFLIASGFHDTETTNPLAYLKRHGAECILVGPELGEVSAYNSNTTLDIEKTINDTEISEYDLLVIPGGNSPRVLNLNEEALRLVQDFMKTEKPVATLCRGPYLLAGAGVLEGRTLTAVSFIEKDIVDAGGVFVDEAVVVDGNLITSREPGDLPVFNRAIIEVLTPKQ